MYVTKSICLLVVAGLTVAGLVAVSASESAAQPFRLPGEQPTGAASSTADGSDPVLGGCKIDLVNDSDIEIPATEPGVLIQLGVKLGSNVQTEDIIARIDPRQAEMEKRVAEYELNSAAKKAKSEIPVLFAAAQRDTAVATLQELEQTNLGVAGAVPEADVRQARLEVRTSELRIQNAEHEQDIAMLDAWVKKAQVEAADMAINRRIIRAPFNGVVIEMFRAEKEWVSPGDPILRLVRLDKLSVKGAIDANAYSVPELKGCEVTVEVEVGNGKPSVTATGRVVYVDPILQSGLNGAKRAIVHAEIANIQEKGTWKIYPNRTARMTVHLGTGGK